MENRSFKHFVEEEVGSNKFPNFIIFAILEWILISLLFLDGLVAFAANQFAIIFNLRKPCLFCTRIDHVMVKNNKTKSRDEFYFNASLCESHKLRLSSLAFCRTHRKVVSDRRRVCEPCLAGEEREFEDYGGDYERFCCCCCGKDVLARNNGESVVKSCYNNNNSLVKMTSMIRGRLAAPSPRGRFSINRRGSDLKFDSSELFGDYRDDKFREDLKAAMLPLLTAESYYEQHKTPTFLRSSSSGSSRFFGIPLTDSATNTPRLTTAASFSRQKSPLGKTPIDNDKSTSSVAAALYAELDEERSASAVAANNAMAMITRLQAEKAAVQMEALQYQRMMEEQFEYDQEALQETNDLLLRREDELRSAEAELEEYRRRFGWLSGGDRDAEDEVGSSCLSFVGEESLKDFKEEKTYILGKNKRIENGVGDYLDEEKEINSPDDDLETSSQ